MRGYGFIRGVRIASSYVAFLLVMARKIAGEESQRSARIDQKPPELTQVSALVGELYTSRLYSPQVAYPYAYPNNVDQAEQQYGMRLYEDMMSDPYCSAPYRYLAARIWGSGMSIIPARSKPNNKATRQEQDEYARAKEIADYVKYLLFSLEETDAPFTETGLIMTEAMIFGHRLAEITAEVKVGGPYNGKPVIASLTPLPREHYRLVVDMRGRLMGAVAQRGGAADSLYSGPVPNVWDWPNFSYKSKFVHFAFDGPSRSPLGSSILRKAYRAWWKTEQADPAEIRAILQAGGRTFAIIASPQMMAVGQYLLPNGESYSGNGMKAAVEWGRELAAGRVAVMPPDIKLETLGGDNVGEIFEPFYARQNRAKVVAILTTARAIMESSRNSMADAGGAENIQDELRNFYQGRICKFFDVQLIRPFVKLTFGADAVHLCPSLSMRQTAAPDLAAAGSAFAQFRSSGGITDPMLPDVIPKLTGFDYIEPDDEEDEDDAASGVTMTDGSSKPNAE